VAANSSISGTKFNDLNGNGVRDAGEPPLSGAEIVLSGFASETTFTDINGHFTFTPLQFGNYGVREIQQAGWIQTTPADSYSVALMLFGIAGQVYFETAVIIVLEIIAIVIPLLLAAE